MLRLRENLKRRCKLLPLFLSLCPTVAPALSSPFLYLNGLRIFCSITLDRAPSALLAGPRSSPADVEECSRMGHINRRPRPLPHLKGLDGAPPSEMVEAQYLMLTYAWARRFVCPVRRLAVADGRL